VIDIAMDLRAQTRSTPQRMSGGGHLMGSTVEERTEHL